MSFIATLCLKFTWSNPTIKSARLWVLTIYYNLAVLVGSYLVIFYLFTLFSSNSIEFLVIPIGQSLFSQCWFPRNNNETGTFFFFSIWYRAIPDWYGRYMFTLLYLYFIWKVYLGSFISSRSSKKRFLNTLSTISMFVFILL